MRNPLDSLLSNWAYMVMAGLAWTLKAWWGLMLPAAGGGRQRPLHEREKRDIVRMEFKRFVTHLIRLPCQILHSGRRLIFRLLSYNPWQPALLRAAAAWRTRSQLLRRPRRSTPGYGRPGSPRLLWWRRRRTQPTSADADSRPRARGALITRVLRIGGRLACLRARFPAGLPAPPPRGACAAGEHDPLPFRLGLDAVSTEKLQQGLVGLDHRRASCGGMIATTAAASSSGARRQSVLFECARRRETVPVY